MIAPPKRRRFALQLSPEEGKLLASCIQDTIYFIGEADGPTDEEPTDVSRLRRILHRLTDGLSYANAKGAA
jgi:hypothetical protein